MRKRLAHWMRKYADRIDHAGAPKQTHWTFTFERGKGVKFREDGRGCPVWYYGDEDYAKAHDESDTAKYDAQWKLDLLQFRMSERIGFGLRTPPNLFDGGSGA